MSRPAIIILVPQEVADPHVFQQVRSGCTMQPESEPMRMMTVDCGSRSSGSALATGNLRHPLETDIIWALERGGRQLSFWSRIAERNTPRIESWITDQFEFLLQIASVAIAYAAFGFMRMIGIAGWVPDFLELMDRIAAVLVFGRFLLSLVRRAFTPTVREP